MSPARPHILMAARLPDWDREALGQRYALHDLAAEGSRLDRIAADIRAVVTTGGRGCSADLIARLPRLELIAIHGVGHDAVDLDAARARGIRVTNTPDVLTDDVADLAVGLVIATVRRMVVADRHVRSGAWTRGSLPLAHRLAGRRAGIVGLGRIGRAVARRLEAFGLGIGYFSRAPHTDVAYACHARLVDLAAWADILVVTLAGGPGTLHLVDARVLAALGPEGYLVNVSRGTTVDETALIAALETGAIAGAGLDVFLNEPDIDPRFFALDNVVLQPHQASATVETRQAMSRLMRDNIDAHFSGRPLPSPVI